MRRAERPTSAVLTLEAHDARANVHHRAPQNNPFTDLTVADALIQSGSIGLGLTASRFWALTLPPTTPHALKFG